MLVLVLVLVRVLLVLHVRWASAEVIALLSLVLLLVLLRGLAGHTPCGRGRARRRLLIRWWRLARRHLMRGLDDGDTSSQHKYRVKLAAKMLLTCRDAQAWGRSRTRRARAPVQPWGGARG